VSFLTASILSVLALLGKSGSGIPALENVSLRLIVASKNCFLHFEVMSVLCLMHLSALLQGAWVNGRNHFDWKCRVNCGKVDCKAVLCDVSRVCA